MFGVDIFVRTSIEVVCSCCPTKLDSYDSKLNILTWNPNGVKFKEEKGEMMDVTRTYLVMIIVTFMLMIKCTRFLKWWVLLITEISMKSLVIYYKSNVQGKVEEIEMWVVL